MSKVLDDEIEICKKNDSISPVLFEEYGVNLGLRDDHGRGVLTGLTNISEITSYHIVNGRRLPCDGELWYRGYRIQDLAGRFPEKELDFERIAYLLLMGDLPGEKELQDFKDELNDQGKLPKYFVRDVIMKASSGDILNSMMRSVLSLGNYDKDSKNTDPENVLRQCIGLISLFPRLAIYSWQAFNYYENGGSLYIQMPDPALSTAENLLKMLRPDGSYTPLEARVLDTALILHMEHGGGNNSTFTTRVVTSTGADTYAVMAAALASLSGPRHGGANIKVMSMMDDIASHVKNTSDPDEVAAYLEKILEGEAFDGQGLLYGMGHAVYTISDPREKLLKDAVVSLAREKGEEKTLEFYETVEKVGPELLMKRGRSKKPVCLNVDFYSGFVYKMLGIPTELYTALFAIARIVGWSAHRLEELISANKIIRPAYQSVMERKE